jgi:hypothetical protein
MIKDAIANVAKLPVFLTANADPVNEVYADIKDTRFPAGLTELTHTTPFEAVVRMLRDTAGHADFARGGYTGPSPGPTDGSRFEQTA